MEIASMGARECDAGSTEVPADDSKVAHGQRLRSLVKMHIDFVGRLLRNLGVTDADVDDAVQQVFVATAAKLDDVPEGKERAFLFGVSLRTAARLRRDRERRREVDDHDALQVLDPAEGPDQLSDRNRARLLLDQILLSMDPELREVFVLYEVEQLTMAEIADLVAIPPGTVASRLRRARDEFGKGIKRIRSKFSGADR
jgi:RNA polymerase sigma-70 factor, ECF subfamily